MAIDDIKARIDCGANQVNMLRALLIEPILGPLKALDSLCHHRLLGSPWQRIEWRELPAWFRESIHPFGEPPPMWWQFYIVEQRYPPLFMPPRYRQRLLKPDESTNAY